MFLEYHPVSAQENLRKESFQTVARRKRANVTDIGCDGRTNLYVFDEIDTLFSIIRDDPELRFYVRHPAFSAHFLKEDWDALVAGVRSKVVEFEASQESDRPMAMLSTE